MLSREMKSRGKRIDNGEWAEGYYIYRNCVNNDTHYIAIRAGVYHEVDPETVGHKVGLKGKNLWQGDICTAEYRCQICFDSEPHLLTGVIEQADNGLWMFEYGHGEVPLDCEDLEITKVVGNIHESPELLEPE